MARNDGILYTGQTSASRRAYRLEEKKREKQKAQNKLMPSAEIVLEFLDKESEFVQKSLLDLVNPNTPESDVKSLIVSLNLYKQSISSVKARLLTVLRHDVSHSEVNNE